MEGTGLLVGLLFSSIGIGYFIYGRKQSKALVKYAGLALMVFTYFVDSIMGMVLVGVALMLAPRFIDI